MFLGSAEHAVVDLAGGEHVYALPVEEVIRPGAEVEVAIGVEEYPLAVLDTTHLILYTIPIVTTQHLPNVPAAIGEVHLHMIL